jgi:predicted nucleic acid-binding protein
MTHYLDASVLVPLFVSEPRSPVVATFLGALAQPPLVSNFAAGEFASAIARRMRMTELTPTDATEAFAEFDHWSVTVAQPLTILPADIAAATALVRRFELKLRLPDAIHLAACQRAGLVLATLDAGLVAAAAALHLPSQLPA